MASPSSILARRMSMDGGIQRFIRFLFIEIKLLFHHTLVRNKDFMNVLKQKILISLLASN